MTSLRILTLNTWKCDGNYRARLAWLLTELGPIRPDVLALQEVFQAQTADTARTIAESLNMGYWVAPARQKVRLFEQQPADSSSGLAVLTRFLTQGQVVRALPIDERDGERLAQYVSLTISGQSVLIINTHLSHLRGASALRQAQLQALLEPLKPADKQGIRFEEQTYSAVFLCGDFNAERHSPEIRFLLNQTRLSVQYTTLTTNGLTPAVTLPNRHSSAPFSGTEIDFIFSIAPTTDQHPIVNQARVVLTEPDANGHYPSDHVGVLIDAILP